MTPRFTVDATRFNSLIAKHSAVFGRSRNETVKSQAKLLTQELIKRTPPLSGKAIKKIVQARGQTLRNPETETLRDKKVGERAILRDRKRIARKTGLRGAALDAEIARRIAHVGQAKSGWTRGHVSAGGKAPSNRGWLGRHGSRYSEGLLRITKGRIDFQASNMSKWASLGEATRIVRESMARRERAMVNQMRRALEKQFGRGAGRAIA